MFSDGSKNQGGHVHEGRNRGHTGAHRPTPRQLAAVTSPLSVSKLLPGPRYIAFYLLALPVIVVAFASSGVEQIVSGLIAVTWLVLAPIALYARRAAMVLPIASALFLGVALVTLSFASGAFVVDVTATTVMFLVSLPRQWSQSMAASSSGRV
jgi:hypothetical protein